jgi:PPM family protein phosphatase
LLASGRAGVAPALPLTAMSPDDARRHVPLLRALDLFRPVSRSRLERLAETVVTMGFAAGAVIVRESDPSGYFYVVVDGEVEVLRSGRAVAALGPGAHFGEIALLRSTPHDNTVVARAPSKLYALEGGEFLAAIESSRRSREVAAAILGERLRS